MMWRMQLPIGTLVASLPPRIHGHEHISTEARPPGASRIEPGRRSGMSDGRFTTVPAPGVAPRSAAERALPHAWARGGGPVLGLFGLYQLVFYLVTSAATWLLAQAGPSPAIAPVTSRAVLALHWHWDAIHYYSIATGGYTAYRDHPVPGTTPDMLFAFFPLLPVLIRIVATLLGGGRVPAALPIADAEPAPLLAGVLVVQAATLLTCWFLFQLAREDTGDPATAARSVFYLLFFPLAFFYAVPYAEPVFLAASLGMFLAARRGHWVRAGLWAAVAAAARPFGILLLPALLVELLLAWRHGALPKQAWGRALLGLFLAPQGLLVFIVYLWRTVGQPFAFVAAQGSFWQREAVFPLLTLWRGITYTLHPSWSSAPDTYARTVLHTVTVLLFLGGLVLALRHGRPSYVVYGVLLFIQLLAVPWPGETIMHTLGRSAMMFFPVYIMLARWGQRPAVHHAILVVWLPVFGLLTAAYAVGYFIA